MGYPCKIVAEKARFRHGVERLQQVKTWQLIILLIIFGFIAATFLRLNNIGMIERRDAVLTADQEGDLETITSRLYDLQRYVSGHMNTDLGRGVYLEASFNRDLAAWQETQYGDYNPNGNVYKKAVEACGGRFSSWSTAYVLCVSSELDKYPPADGSASEANRPREETYIYSYVSPFWSPDFAGWSVLICLVLIILIVVRVLARGVLQLLLRHHYKRL